MKNVIASCFSFVTAALASVGAAADPSAIPGMSNAAVNQIQQQGGSVNIDSHNNLVINTGAQGLNLNGISINSPNPIILNGGTPPSNVTPNNFSNNPEPVVAIAIHPVTNNLTSTGSIQIESQPAQIQAVGEPISIDPQVNHVIAAANAAALSPAAGGHNAVIKEANTYDYANNYLSSIGLGAQ